MTMTTDPAYIQDYRRRLAEMGNRELRAECYAVQADARRLHGPPDQVREQLRECRRFCEASGRGELWRLVAEQVAAEEAAIGQAEADEILGR